MTNTPTPDPRAFDHLLVDLILITEAETPDEAIDACWGLFAQWCTTEGHQPLPADPATVLGFLADLVWLGFPAELADTLLVAIDQVHDDHGFASPVPVEESGR